jgi:hypothetical protein
MSIGNVGYPLIRGNSDQIETKFVSNAVVYDKNYAGRAVVMSDSSNESGNQTVQCVTTALLDMPFAGITSLDFEVGKNGEALCGVVNAGKKIPVPIQGSITDLKQGVAFNEDGFFVQGDTVGAKKINALFRSKSTYKAIGVGNVEVDVALMDLYVLGDLPVLTAAPAALQADESPTGLSSMTVAELDQFVIYNNLTLEPKGSSELKADYAKRVEFAFSESTNEDEELN